jgi:hypothetical protein
MTPHASPNIPSQQIGHPDKADLFRAVQLKYSRKLGDAIAQSETSHAYQAAYEHAMVLWIDGQKAFYQLPSDPAKKWVKYPDPDWQSDPEWYRDVDLRRRFRPPPGLGPPYAGVASRWVRDPDNWTWIGWRQWHCSFDPNQVFLQRFEHGTMLVPFRLHPLNKAAQVFVLLDDGSWSSESATVDAPPCSEPPWQGEIARP